MTDTVRALSEDQLLEMRTQARQQCDPLVAQLTGARVESICEEMVNLADEFVSRLADDAANNTRDPQVTVRPHRAMGGVYLSYLFLAPFLSSIYSFYLI
jgi:hypothetical protein